jgi:hypothetical protein
VDDAITSMLEQADQKKDKIDFDSEDKETVLNSYDVILKKLTSCKE